MNLRFAKTLESAILQAKKDFAFTCCITGVEKDDIKEYHLDLEGAHLFQKSTYQPLKFCINNIFPINERDHADRRYDCMDYITYKDTGGSTISRNRTVPERTIWLLQHFHSDWATRGRARLRELLEGIESEIKDREILAMLPELKAIMEEYET